MRLWATTLTVLLLAAPVAAQEAIARYGDDAAPRRLTVRSTTDIAVFGPILAAFLEGRPDLAIDYEQWGSNALFDLAGQDCAARRAGADLVISSGVHQMVWLVNEGCALAHRSDLTAALPAQLNWRDEVWGVTSEPAVIVYNRALVPPGEVPLSRFDLLDLLRPADTRYAGRVATYDIEASGLGFLFAFIDSQEAATFGGLLESLGRTGAVVTCCSAEIIDGVANGSYYIAYNVLGSYALARAASDDRIGVVAPNDYTLMLSRAAMIPREAVAAADAAQLIDFMLSDAGRVAMTAALLIVSIDAEGEPGTGGDGAEGVQRPIPLSPWLLVALDQHKRAAFIRRWRETFPAEAPDRHGPATD